MSAELARKVAQLIFVGVSGPELTAEEKKHLNELVPGGVILFKRNYQNLSQIISLTNSIQGEIMPLSHNNLATWIGVDHEGGRVQRFGEPFTKIPAAQQWGELNSPKTTFELGYIIAKELHSVGVRVNFAPVADVPTSMSAPALGDRVFSTDPEIVANLVSATVRGLQKGGVLSVTKHFPGLGPANIDSHGDLPTCNVSKAELDARDWVPFRRAIRARADGVMTAHLTNAALDPENPATLSKKILRDILRGEFRYQKLIFSDDMEMGAIANHHSVEDASVMAVAAGCDHILICQNMEAARKAHEKLLHAFESRKIPMNHLIEALSRIEQCKAEYIGNYRDATVEFAEAVLGAPDFQAVAEAVRQKRAVEDGPSTKVKANS